MMSEYSSHIPLKNGSEKSFGLVFSLFFLILFFWFYFQFSTLKWWLLGLSLAFSSIALFSPKALKIPNFIWFQIGVGLGKMMTPIVMGAFFFLIIIPTSLFVRIFKKDSLAKGFSPDKKTYWIDKDTCPISMKDQF